MYDVIKYIRFAFCSVFLGQMIQNNINNLIITRIERPNKFDNKCICQWELGCSWNLFLNLILYMYGKLHNTIRMNCPKNVHWCIEVNKLQVQTYKLVLLVYWYWKGPFYTFMNFTIQRLACNSLSKFLTIEWERHNHPNQSTKYQRIDLI